MPYPCIDTVPTSIYRASLPIEPYTFLNENHFSMTKKSMLFTIHSSLTSFLESVFHPQFLHTVSSTIHNRENHLALSSSEQTYLCCPENLRNSTQALSIVPSCHQLSNQQWYCLVLSQALSQVLPINYRNYKDLFWTPQTLIQVYTEVPIIYGCTPFPVTLTPLSLLQLCILSGLN